MAAAGSLHLCARRFLSQDAFPAGIVSRSCERDIFLSLPLRRDTGKWSQLPSDIAPAPRIPPKAGEFNHSRLMVKGKHCEHWLNGAKVVEFDACSAEVQKLLRSNLPAGAASDAPLVEGSLISLQNHKSEVWFRNIMIRVLLQN